jgi:acyl-coenzyme A synthetase/AMP-(fatty) acid ligase
MDAHRLRVLGRSDELLNVGGIKYSPDTIENLIVRDARVRDVAVCSLRNAAGIEEVCVLVVADGLGDRDLQARVLGPMHHLQLGRVCILNVDVIPRTAAGKVQRDRLRSLVRSATLG